LTQLERETSSLDYNNTATQPQLTDFESEMGKQIGWVVVLLRHPLQKYWHAYGFLLTEMGS
jgi:hypothetical protein